MKHRWKGALAMMAIALAGCEGGKQAAILAMDEARLNIAAAEKAGADQLAWQTLARARRQIKTAEDALAAKQFREAKEAASTANIQAINATAEAKDKAAKKSAFATKKSTAAKTKRR